MNYDNILFIGASHPNDMSRLTPLSFRWHRLSNTFCLILLASYVFK